MRTVADILSIIDRVSPLDKAADWDPVGLQLGDRTSPAGTVGVCHEVTDEVVAAALDAGIGTLVTYHPLLFRPMRSVVAGHGPVGRAYRLLRQGVSLLVVHTAFDAVAGGCADALAQTLGLSDVLPFGPLWPGDAAKVVTFVPAAHADAVRDAMSAGGAGVIGRYSSCSFATAGRGTFLPGPGADPSSGTVGAASAEDEVRLEMITPSRAVDAVVANLVAAHPYDEPGYDVIATRSNAGFAGRVGVLATTVAGLADLVEERLGATPRVAGKGSVTRVAVVAGSGGDFIEAASAIADAIVTGDVGHHRARAGLDRGCAVVDPGHGATERPGVQRLYAAVAEEVEPVVDLTHLQASPWEET